MGGDVGIAAGEDFFDCALDVPFSGGRGGGGGFGDDAHPFSVGGEGGFGETGVGWTEVLEVEGVEDVD